MNEEDIGWVMKACIVLHNMIIEDERGIDGLENAMRFADDEVNPPVLPRNDSGEIRVTDFLKRYFDIRDNEVHKQLQKDLMHHLWLEKGKY